MNEMTVFNNQEFGQVRTIMIDNEPWFVGKDVATYFGDTNYRRSLSRLDVDERGVSQIDTPGGKQEVTIINESGFYSLLFYMQPQKAKGVSQNDTLINERIAKIKKFKRWVTSEVLPALRKTGEYSVKKKPPVKSLRDVVEMVKITKETMQEQGCSSKDIATAVQQVAEQFNVNLPNCFIRPEETSLNDVYDMIDYIYQQPCGKGHKKPTFSDFIISKTTTTSLSIERKDDER